MRLNYTYIINQLYSTLIENPKLNPADSDNRYINQLLKQRFIPGAPFPAVLLSVSNKREAQMAMAYVPAVDLVIAAKIYCSLPESNPCQAVLDELGVSAITTGELVEKENYLIVSEIEEWLRADNTIVGQQRRILNSQGSTEINLKPIMMPVVVFDMMDIGTRKLSVTTIQLALNQIRIL